MILDDVTNNGYEAIKIRKNIRPDDFWKYKIDPKKITDISNGIADDFIQSNFSVHSINPHNIRGNMIFTVGSIYDCLTIRRTNQIIKQNLKYQTFSREEEICQLWTILKEEENNKACNTWVFRSDIKSFFESIPFKEVIDDMLHNGIINYSSYKHLLAISTKIMANNNRGLPRGLPVSSSISEYVLLNFDKSIREMSSCLYYARYVDDIIVIISDNPPDLTNEIASKLPYGLKLNPEKTQVELIGSAKRIDFLGFSFPLDNPHSASITTKKIDRIKKRIILALKRYLNIDNDFELLLNRLKFLSGTTNIKIAGRENNIAVGIKYQYAICREEIIISQLKSIDIFYKRILYSKKFNVSIRLRTSLSPTEFTELLKISFVGGFKSCITHNRSRKKISLIKDGWRYE
jgi:hypothetical protein